MRAVTIVITRNMVGWWQNLRRICAGAAAGPGRRLILPMAGMHGAAVLMIIIAGGSCRRRFSLSGHV
jgi:hypothetical protein